MSDAIVSLLAKHTKLSSNEILHVLNVENEEGQGFMEKFTEDQVPSAEDVLAHLCSF